VSIAIAGLEFSDLYNFAAKKVNDTSSTGVSRAKDAVDEANRLMSYGEDLPLMRPWWRKREDMITAVEGTQTYAFPTNQGTLESLHDVWYRTDGRREHIRIVNDLIWSEEANEDTTERGTPFICNIHQSSGTVNIRFSLTPSGSFVSQLTGTVIRLDFFIEETLTFESGDTVEPLMPDTRRYGIAWKAVEILAAGQNDFNLVAYAAGRGRRYYQLILADDILRTGKRVRNTRPTDPVGLFGRFSRRAFDYDHHSHGHR